MILPNAVKNIGFLGIGFTADEATKQQILITNFVLLLLTGISSSSLIVSCIENYQVAYYSCLLYMVLLGVLFYLQSIGKHLLALLTLTFITPAFLFFPSFCFSTPSNENNTEYFYLFLGSAMLPLLLYGSPKDSRWLAFGIINGLLLILFYDSIFCLNSALQLKSFDIAFFIVKFKQLMLWALLTGGYLAKQNCNFFGNKKILHRISI